MKRIGMSLQSLTLVGGLLVAFLWGTVAAPIVFGASSSSSSSNSSSSSSSSSSNRNSSSNNNNNNNNDNNDEAYTRNLYGLGYRSAVGGFAIDAGKAFRTATRQEIADEGTRLRSLLAEIPAGLDQAAPMRKISLKRLSAELAACEKENRAPSDAVRLLGGLTSIDYIAAVPEENDIYLAGPAEGWTTTEDGTIVGKQSGKPILLLEDLLTIIRAWNTKTPEVITCSIDPTPEGIARVASLGSFDNPAEKEQACADALGMMKVSFSGIPAESRMAWVLAAADYRLKTISLGFEDSPLNNFPSYTSLMKVRGAGQFGQRFWISPEYGTIRHDTKGLVWNLTGTDVQTLTEREYFDKDGNRRASSKKDAAALKWAGNMTNRYAEIAKEVPIFAEAKNCMDLALAVALVFHENLSGKANCPLDLLINAGNPQKSEYSAPTEVPGWSLCRVVRNGSVTVTGGISINPWEALEKNAKLDTELDGLKVAFASESWWAD